MLKHLVAFWLLLLAGPVFAACQGSDLRTTLSAEEQQHLQATLAETPFSQGNHWRATRDGKVVHLIGTLHLTDPRLDAPAARLQPIVEGADLLLLEMTAEDEADLEQRLSSDPSFFLMQDTTLPELLDEDTWQQMATALSARGLPPFMASRFQPWYVSLVLAIPACAPLDELSDDGMDARLESFAQIANVPRAALEDVSSVFDAFADQPRDVQIDMMLSALVDPAISEDLFETLLSAYFEENTAESWQVSALLAERYSPIAADKAAGIFDILERQLLIDRNLAWIPVIEEATARHDKVVAAFGAAHLPGKDGVIALLEARGFTLERLPF